MLALGSLGRVRIHFYHSGVLGFQPVNITAQFYANPEHPAPNVSPGKGGLQAVYLADASGYISFTDDWRVYVVNMNAEAARWLAEHRLGENHGYILTSASEREHRHLPRRVSRP
jgi:hypothetical protein